MELFAHLLSCDLMDSERRYENTLVTILFFTCLCFALLRLVHL